MSLLKNSALNLAGAIVPGLVAIPALAYLARDLSVPLLGVFMLIWALLGYGGAFDAGLGRAVVRHISLHAQSPALHGTILGTALLFVAVTGTLVALALYRSADFVAIAVFSASRDIAVEGGRSLRIAAWCVPILLVSTVLQSYLEGLERFIAFNVYRSISGSVVYVFPVLALILGGDFAALMMGFLLARVVSLALVAAVVAKDCPPSRWRFKTAMLGELFRFGGWLTVTAVVSPFMVYMDRIIIAKLLGAGTVAAYTAPAELVNRMSFLPAAISRALFPRLASSTRNVESDRDERRRAYLYMASLTAPIAVVSVVAAQPLITLWLGHKFAQSSPPVFAVMAIGFFFNCLALVPYSSLQAKGFSKVTATVHLAEVIPYLASLIAATSFFGILGAAWVWSARMLIDLLLMWRLDLRFVQGA